MNKDFMVYTLIGQFDYEPSTVLGVFASYDDMIAWVESKTWGYDYMTYAASFIGEQFNSTDREIEIDFPRVARAY